MVMFSVSHCSQLDVCTLFQSFDQGSNGDNEDVSSTATWESIFSDLAEMQMVCALITHNVDWFH